MTLYPHAQWRPLADQQPAKMTRHDLVILHTMVGSLAGTDQYFHDGGYGGTESHFGVGYQGLVYQWTDLECRADANLDANSRAISIETADWGEGPFGKWDTSNPALVPAWTPEQIEAIAQIVAWCCDRWSIPCVLVDAAPGRRGVSIHRKGIDPYRNSGDEHWSTSYGKVCPGDKRTAQAQQVVNRAADILAGGDQKGDWFDMATKEELAEVVRDQLNTGTAQGLPNWGETNKYMVERLLRPIYNTTNAIALDVDSIQEMVEAAMAGLPPGAGTEEIASAVADELAKRLTPQEG